MLASSAAINLEKELDQALTRHFAEGEGKTPPHLAEAIRYSLLSPGKRIRPRLVLSTAELVGLPISSALPAAIALEMIHCFTLIHDDLPCMDDDDVRRGRPTNHKVFGEALALLSGDALMALALDVFMEAASESEHRDFLNALKRLSWAMGPRGVIGGQAAESLLDEKSNLKQLRQMHSQKTGALFAASILIPKDLKGIADDSKEGLALAAFAHELGLAFQTADDLEDAVEALDPTSVLYFLDKDAARKQAVEGLTHSIEGLKSAFPDRHHGLLSLAGEVMRKLEIA